VISLVSERHHHRSMMHLSTHQDISLGLKIVHVHHLAKHLMGQVVFTFLGVSCFSLGRWSFVWGITAPKSPIATRLGPEQLNNEGALEMAH